MYKGIFADQDNFFATHGANVRDIVQAHHRELVKELVKKEGVDVVLRQALQDTAA